MFPYSDYFAGLRLSLKGKLMVVAKKDVVCGRKLFILCGLVWSANCNSGWAAIQT
jgi:hypothetical protein